jgi:RecT family
MNAIVPAGNTALTPTSMESAIKLAEMMAKGKLVPQHLHNSPGDCLMVIEASMRWQMSPFAVAQCTSVIQGKLMFEGKLVAAALNASGILSARLDYDFSGEKDQRAVTVRATLRGETKPREVRVFLADAKTANGMWTKQPDQQLVYAGTRVWARRHAPEVMLGVYAPEEFDQAMPFNGTTLEGETEAPPAVPSPRDQINAMPRAPVVRAPVESTPPNGKKRTVGDFLQGLRIAGRDALKEPNPAEAVDRLICGEEVLRMKAYLKDQPLADLNKIITELLLEVTPAAPPDASGDTDEMPEVEIAGEEKVGAG